MFSGRLPGGRLGQQMVLARAVHLVSLVVAFGILMYLGRRLWFFFDEWDVVGNPSLVLLAPHNEHWSTIPYLVYGALYPIFGLRTYAPYLAVTLLLHVGVAHVLWRVMILGQVKPWLATALSGVFLFLGAGAENLVWAFQMGFVGSVFFGLIEVRLVDQAGSSHWRDLTGWVAATAALMCSDIGVVMVLMAGIVALLRRGWRAFMSTVVPPTLVFLAWYATYGYRGQPAHSAPRLGSLVQFVYSGLASTLGEATGLDNLHLGGVLVLLLVAWGLYSARRLGKDAPAALAGLFAAVAFFAVVSLGRAEFGVDYSQSSRYLYIATAMLLPVIGVALSSVANMQSRIEPPLIVLLLASAGVGGGTLRMHYHVQTELDAFGERHILAAADLLQSGVRTAGRLPDPHFAPQLSIDRVDLFRRAGALPAEAGATTPTLRDREEVQVQLQLALTPRRLLPALPNGVAASVSQAEMLVRPDGCWQLTSRGAAPELRLRSDQSFSIELMSGHDNVLGLAGAPAGAAAQVLVAPLQLHARVPGYLNSVLVPGVITVGLPIGETVEVCGLEPPPRR